MPPELTVVFINYNSARLLDRALSSLRASEPGSMVEALVVDNASCDRAEAVETCRRNGARLLVLGRNAGYGTAANRGFRHAQGRYVAVANPDLVFPQGAASALVRFLDGRPEAGIVAPQLVYEDGTPQPTARRFPRLRYALAGRRSLLARLLPGSAAVRDFLYADVYRALEPVRVESVTGALMVIRREALEQVGGFDENYVMYAEDSDICRRVGRNWGIYLLPTVRVVHLVGQTRRRFRAFSEYHRIRSHRRFFRADSTGIVRPALDLMFAFYLMLQEAVGLVGLGEYEYSWAAGARQRGRT